MPVYYLAAIFLLLLLIAGYLFLSHSIEKRRIRRQRLITALRARRNSFRDLVTGFPQGFLSNDLTSFLYRSLIDSCEQLSRLEPQDPKHLEQVSFYTAQLSNLQTTAQQQRVRLDNAEQMKEAKHLLQELYKFIKQQTAMKLISEVQAAAYSDQVQRLVLQMGVDEHIFSARQAQQIGKLRLAIHHFNLARKLLLAENTSHNFSKQIQQLDEAIAKLEEKAGVQREAPQGETPAGEPAPAAEVSKEWDQFEKENSEWKKKQIYD